MTRKYYKKKYKGITTVIPSRDPFFSDEIIPLFDDSAYRTICDIISSAALSCFILAYDIRIVSPHQVSPVNNILGLLKYKKEQGVDVRILLNGYVSGHLHDKFNLYTYNVLKKDGFNVRRGIPKKMIHAKMVIVDEKLVFLGSHNFTKSSLSNNRETGVLISSRPKSAGFTIYFSELWEESS